MIASQGIADVAHDRDRARTPFEGTSHPYGRGTASHRGHSIDPARDSSHDHGEPCHLSELGDLLKSEVNDRSWLNLDVSLELSFGGRRIAALNDDAPTLWDDKLAHVQAFGRLYVNIVVFIDYITSV